MIVMVLGIQMMIITSDLLIEYEYECFVCHSVRVQVLEHTQDSRGIDQSAAGLKDVT